MEEQGFDWMAIIERYGVLYAFFVGILYTIANQFYRKRDAIFTAIGRGFKKVGDSLAEGITIRNKNYIQKKVVDVSNIYGNMYTLKSISPVRVQVVQYAFKTKKGQGHSGSGKAGHHAGGYQFWECTIIHEIVFAGQPTKHMWQGVDIDEQHQQHIVELISSGNAVQAIEDIPEMNDGDYKYSLMSEEATSVYNIMMEQNGNLLQVLTVMLNRKPPVEGEEIAKMKQVAKNIKNLL